MNRRAFLSGLMPASALVSTGLASSLVASQLKLNTPGERIEANKTPEVQPSLKESDDYLVSQAASGSFRGSVLVGMNGKVIFQKGYGFADQEWKVNNSPSTKFRIASLTKQFTGASILLLQERGLLQVKEAASKYVSDLPSAWQSITIHQLLTHTSGIANYVGLPRTDEYFRTGATPRDMLAMAATKPLEFAPGSQLRYTNSGYVLLGMVIEKVSGGSYEHFLQQNIFAALGMVDSGYDHASTILSERASGYMIKNGHLVNADFVDMSFPYAAGGIYSTVGDMYLWNEGLANGKLLSESSMQQMFAVYPETLSQGMHYGYGVVIAERFGKLLYYHGGGVQGFETVIQRYPKERLCIVVLENLDPTKPWDIADHIAAGIFGQPLPSGDRP